MEVKKSAGRAARARAEGKPADIRELTHEEAAQISGGVHWTDKVLGELMDDVSREGLRKHKEN